MKNIAVDGASIQIQGTRLVSFGAITLSGTFSDNVIIDGKKAFCGEIKGTCTSITFYGSFVSGPVDFVIKSSAEYVFADEKNVILQGDSSDAISVEATAPNGITNTFSVTAKVSDSGQSKVTAE